MIFACSLGITIANTSADAEKRSHSHWLCCLGDSKANVANALRSLWLARLTDLGLTHPKVSTLEGPFACDFGLTFRSIRILQDYKSATVKLERLLVLSSHLNCHISHIQLTLYHTQFKVSQSLQSWLQFGRLYILAVNPVCEFCLWLSLVSSLVSSWPQASLHTWT